MSIVRNLVAPPCFAPGLQASALPRNRRMAAPSTGIVCWGRPGPRRDRRLAGRGRMGGTREGHAPRPDDAPQRQSPVPLRRRHDRRDDARKEDRLAIHIATEARRQRAVEVHAFQRLENGLTMIAETGNRRIIEVDREGSIVREVPLTVDKPNAHRDTRMARKLPDGHYLVCHEGDGTVREYDQAGKVVWSYALDLDGRPRTPGHEGHGTDVFGAIRLPSGNTLIATGSGNRVIEVTPEGKVVWKIGHDELPGIRLFWVTTLQLLPERQSRRGQLPRRARQPTAFRGDPRQAGRLDLQGLQDLRQQSGRGAGARHQRRSAAINARSTRPHLAQSPGPADVSGGAGREPTRSKALNRSRKVPWGWPRCWGRNPKRRMWPPRARTSTSAAFPSIFSGPSSHPLSRGRCFA